jgi:hypothetical protein
MNDNLAEMVKDTKTPPSSVFAETDLDIPDVKETAGPLIDKTPELDEATTNSNIVTITTMAEWFERNCDLLDNINQVKVAIVGSMQKKH